MNQGLSKHEKLIAWVSGLGVPIALMISSSIVSTSIETTKVDSEYVKIAINILSNGNQKEMTKEDKAVRSWAIRVLDSKSPVKFSEEEKMAFIDNKVAFPSLDALNFNALEAEFRIRQLNEQLMNVQANGE
ncbi:hypothetical protein FWP56_22360 [Vibrio vulnificus]|uniref:hypothetical protein n=1 Tax=Vibrio cidicii TaxID=1763883 RepID=UPI00077FFEBB|nr:hypothetical protein [Vibrio cidicii]EGQ9976238.1 hypothetical protein [Vibrio vulnificus]ELH5152394.1 hypothetical protein [Vibrio cholerae]EHH0850090.1 hypothetical protein [Vibrio vulnificus]EHH1187547.1 hypothetical protein [Vibrio vulnificus]EHY9871001.1 hypothetical protein [Vibrio vulnificus]